MAMFTLGNFAPLMLALPSARSALPPRQVEALVALANLGAGIAIPAMTSSMMALGQGRHATTAAASLNANRQVGAMLGVAMVGMALHAVPDWPRAMPVAAALLALAYAVAAALAMAGNERPAAQGPLV